MTLTEQSGSTELTKNDFESLARFRFGIRRYLGFSEETVRGHGVTPQQYQLLLALKGYPGREWATVRELADWLRLRHHSVVELVDRVQQLGMVRRAADPDDARVARVELTDQGNQLLGRLSALHRDELRRMGSATAPPDWDDAHDAGAHDTGAHDTDVQGSLADRIVAATQDAVIYADREGVIRLWNTGAETIFGYSADEAVGKSLDLIIPEKQRQRHWDGWDRVMATGKTRYGSEPLAVPGVRADGSRVSLEFSITMLWDSEDRIAGIAAVLRDVTARWKQDRELRKRLAELESR